MKFLRFLALVFSLFLADCSSQLLAQTSAVYVDSSGNMTNPLLNIPSGKTLNLNGTLGGTPSGGTLDLGSVTLKVAPTGASASSSIGDQLIQIGINVKTYAGAKGDGVTDDTAAIRTAAFTGLDIHFPEGIFIISDYIPIQSVGQKVKGAGPNRSFLRQTTSGKGIFVLLNPNGDGIPAHQWQGLYNGGSGIYLNEISDLSLETSHANTGVAILAGHVFLTGCTTVSGSTTVACDSTVGLFAGQSVTGANIPSSTTVASVTDATHFVLSNAASGSGSTLSLEAGSAFAGDWLSIHDVNCFQFANHVYIDSVAHVRMERVVLKNATSIGSVYGTGLVITGSDANSNVVQSTTLSGFSIGADLSGSSGAYYQFGDAAICATAVRVESGELTLGAGHYEENTLDVYAGYSAPSIVHCDGISIVTDPTSSQSPIVANHASLVTGLATAGPLKTGIPIGEGISAYDQISLDVYANASDYGLANPEGVEWTNDALGKTMRFSSIPIVIGNNNGIPGGAAQFHDLTMHVLNGNGVGPERWITFGEQVDGSYAVQDLFAQALLNLNSTWSRGQVFAPSVDPAVQANNVLAGGDADERGALVSFADRSPSPSENVADIVIRPHDYNTGEQIVVARNRDGSVANRILSFGHGAAAGDGYIGIPQGLEFPNRVQTALGTDGAQTINAIAGSVNFAASATSLVVTDSYSTISSIIYPVIQTHGTGAVIESVVPGNGSFTIYLSTPGSVEVTVGFLITN